MASTNVISIPMYNKGYLTAYGYREGCGYNTKIFWGTELLASSSSLIASISNAYVGVRLMSPKFHGWLTPELRVEILDGLIEMGSLVFPKELHWSNEGLLKNLKVGMKWFLDNKLEIKLGEGCINPIGTIEEIKNDFFKSERLTVHISLLTDFKDDVSKDLLSVSLQEEAKKDTIQMCVKEDNLPVHMFGRDWTNRAVTSFNGFRRISSPSHPIYPTTEKLPWPEKMGMGIKVGDHPEPARFVSRSPSNLHASFEHKSGDTTLLLNGNTISLQASGSVLVNAPKINIENNGPSDAANYLLKSFHENTSELSEFGLMIRKVGLSSSIELDKNIPIYFVQAYAELPYFDVETKLPMSMMDFIKLIGWNYLETDFDTWIQSPKFASLELPNKDQLAWEIVALAIQLKSNKEVTVYDGAGTNRRVQSVYLA